MAENMDAAALMFILGYCDEGPAGKGVGRD